MLIEPRILYLVSKQNVTQEMEKQAKQAALASAAHTACYSISRASFCLLTRHYIWPRVAK